MWIQKKIREDLNHLYPCCLYKLHSIHTIPQEKAIKIVAYLWEGCFQSSNDIWITVCSGLLYEIPEKWLEEHIQEVLHIINIEWNDDFEYYNLCSVFRHIPSIMEQILEYAKSKITTDNVDDLICDVEEMIGDRRHYEGILKEFACMDKKDLLSS